jgi:hypothetical protein
MSIQNFENLLEQLEQRVASSQVVEFNLDATLACGAALRSDRDVAIATMSGSQIAEADVSLLLCFDVVAVASALALRGLATRGPASGDRQSALVDLWGAAQAARTLWGDHFLFAVSPAVEGRIEAIRETARVLGGHATGFSIQTGCPAPQFADFVAKGLP